MFIVECVAGTFRSNEVNKCLPCPPNSNASKTGSAICKCIEGFYRHPVDGNHMPCYKLPGAPMNLTLLFVDQTSAILSWSAPTKDLTPLVKGVEKYQSDIVYKIRCSMCSANVVYNPAADTFNETKITLTNLEPVTTYTIQIHATNGISYLIDNGNYSNETYANSDNHLRNSSNTATINGQQLNLNEIKTSYAEIVFTTESVMFSTVLNLRVVDISSKGIELVWDKPLQTDTPIELYEVRWFPKSDLDAINKTSIHTKDSKVNIIDLLENTEYGFQVRCKTINGFGSYSNMVYAQTHQTVGSGN